LRSPIPQDDAAIALAAELGAREGIPLCAARIQTSFRRHGGHVEVVPLRVFEGAACVTFSVAAEGEIVGGDGDGVCVGEGGVLVDGEAVEAAAGLGVVAWCL
jgi:hypothetical protein